MPDITVLENGNVLVSIPITLRESAGRKQIITDQKKFKAENDPIVLNIARGFYWQEMIDNGKIVEVNRWRNRKSLLRTLIRERNGSEKSWFLQGNARQGNSSKLQSLIAGVCRTFTGMQS